MLKKYLGFIAFSVEPAPKTSVGRLESPVTELIRSWNLYKKFLLEDVHRSRRKK